MEYNYKVGEKFELPVTGRGYTSESAPYLVVWHKDSGREFRIFNLMKCQQDEDTMPTTLYTKVAYVDAFGKVKMKQDLEKAYGDHYTVGEYYPFKVVSEAQDNNGKHYYIVDDDIDVHRFYKDGGYRIDEHVLLMVDSISPKDYLNLTRPHRQTLDASTPQQVAKSVISDTPVRVTGPVLEVGDESQTLEFKTSIVFTPDGVNEVNVDKQIGRILKVLAAFMNTDGGTLYIGVHDKTKEIIGIQQDYPYLNDSEQDVYTYGSGRDSYQLKIRNELKRLCTGHAGELVKFTFDTVEGREYCRIDVEKASRPVWYRGSHFYIREGNQNTRLADDVLTLHIFGKMKSDLGELFAKQTNVPENLPVPAPRGELDYKILWFDDRTWVRTKSEENYPKPAFTLDVPKDIKGKNLLLVLGYESGNVNVVNFAEFRKGANLNIRQKDGWFTDEKPSSIFLMEANDYLVGYSVDQDGIQYVKLHAISDFAPSLKARNKGGRFVPQVHHVTLYAPLSADYRKEFRDLIVPKAQRATNPGTPLDSATMQDQLEALANTLTHQQY